MEHNPILAHRMTKDGKFIVHGGLHYIKGNHAPYFTLTYDLYDKRGEMIAGGAGHDEILKYYPEFQDIADLHLSDIDGIPMHAVENGWYWYGGTKWQERDNKILAHHLRITQENASRLNFNTKEEFAAYCKKQEKRWKQEAYNCIKRHNLIVFGDKYPD